MCQLFWTAKSIQVLGNNDSLVAKMFHLVWWTYNIFFIGPGRILFARDGQLRWSEKGSRIGFWSSGNSAPKQSDAFLPGGAFRKPVGNQETLTIAMNCKRENNIAHLVQSAMKAWLAVGVRRGLESWKSFAQPYLHYDCNQGILQLLSNQDDGYSPVE